MDNNTMTIEYKGKTIACDQPYADSVELAGDGWVDVMRALGADDEGHEYDIVWRIVNDECEDGTDACDWSDYLIRRVV